MSRPPRRPPPGDDDARVPRGGVGGRAPEREEHDTLEEQGKLAGRQRPAPRRGMESIVDPSVPRERAIVVGALPAHVEVLLQADLDAGRATRDRVLVARVHPALVAAVQSPVVVGDRVSLATLAHEQRFVVELEPRTSAMVRPEVERGRAPQPLVANADALVIVVAVAEPPLRPGLVDRFLVAAAAAGLSPILCATKLDLPDVEEGLHWLDYYERIGIRAARTSIRSGAGLEEIRAQLAGRFSVLVGKSGVGKSSLVRAILPEEPIAVAEISAATGKGRHTTTVTRYYRLPEGGAVVDTPGLRELGLWSVTRENLDPAFPEIAALAAGCRFLDCRHFAEPGCAVRDAPELPPERLSSFRKLLEEVELRARPGFGKPGGPSAYR